MFGLHKIRGVSSLVEQVVASEGELRSNQLVSNALCRIVPMW
jgi:hypothetical protein